LAQVPRGQSGKAPGAMGQRCSCDEECTPGMAVGVFQKPEATAFADASGDSRISIVDSTRFDELKDPAVTASSRASRNNENTHSVPPFRSQEPPPAVLQPEATEVIEPPETAPEVTPVQDTSPKPDNAFAFEVSLTVDKQQAGAGLKLVREEGVPAVLVVADILEGPAAVWNASQKDREEFSIQRMDRILSVNGQSCEQLTDLTDVQQEGQLTVTAQRWQERYQIKLKRESGDDKLGMKLELVERVGGARSLRIGQVGGGLMAAWNVSALAAGRPQEVVTPGTEVLQVNALSDSHEDMMTALQSGDVELTLRRPDLRTIHRLEVQRANAAVGALPGA